MTSNRERRRAEREAVRALKAQLNEDQRFTLSQIENFGWELKFIRRPPFQPSVAVVFDGSRSKFAILEPDGTLNENPDIVIRE